MYEGIEKDCVVPAVYLLPGVPTSPSQFELSQRTVQCLKNRYALPTGEAFSSRKHQDLGIRTVNSNSLLFNLTPLSIIGVNFLGITSVFQNQHQSRFMHKININNGCWQTGMDAYSSSSEDWDTLPKLSVSEVLNQISLEQIPSEEHARKCQDIALRVIAVLEKEMGPGLSGHVMVAGSYGKGTAIANDSDYDIVIFFNELEPPFNKVLNSMENAIKDNADKFKGFIWRFRSTIHVCFDVEGIQFDLTPAAQLDHNFPWNRWCCFAPSPLTPYPSQQYINTLKKITELKDPEKMSYLYSSSLSIDAVIFVQRQCTFIHSVIRLAKHWARHINTGRIQIRGKSILLETVAIHACYSLSPVEMIDRNMDKAFLKFLEYFSDANNLRLYVFVNYQRDDIPDAVFNQTPLVLDPANPYNNLLSPLNFPSLALKCFQEAAQLTIKKVNAWEKGDCDDMSEFRRMLKGQDNFLIN